MWSGNFLGESFGLKEPTRYYVQILIHILYVNLYVIYIKDTGVFHFRFSFWMRHAFCRDFGWDTWGHVVDFLTFATCVFKVGEVYPRALVFFSYIIRGTGISTSILLMFMVNVGKYIHGWYGYV